MTETKPDSGHKIKSKSIINLISAWIILFVALTLTGIYTYNTKQEIERNALQDFSFECSDIKANVNARLYAHEAVLRTGAAFIEASDTVTRQEWNVFFTNQKIQVLLPESQGLGYAMIVDSSLLMKHEQNIRKSGFPDYSIKPAGPRRIYTTIIYIEPFSGRNKEAFGYDMYSDSIRRKAMNKACDSNIASLADKVTLVQETNKDIQAGTLMYVPVYRSGMPINTIAERRKAIKGWAYSAYRINNFMSGVLGNSEKKLKENIRMQIYDNDSILPEALLFDSQTISKKKYVDSKILRLKLPFVFKGKNWTLYFSKAMDISSFYFHQDVILVLFGGTLISLLIFFLAVLLLKNRYRLKLSSQLAATLKANLDKQVAVYNAIPDAIFLTDGNTGLIEEVNRKASEQYGYSDVELKTMKGSELSSLPTQNDSTNSDNELISGEQFHKKKNGTLFPVEISSSTFELSQLKKVITVARDITERKKAEDLLLATLKEKEILLREVHHRVKNNLQVVSSLLNLQANKIDNKTIKETLEQSRNRIRSIALVHEKLYQTGNYAEINLKEYSGSLLAELFRAYLTDQKKIQIHTEIENVNIPLIYAIPCGLILNEIISNSLKYAFPTNYIFEPRPEIFITVKSLPDKKLQISAGDNGIGLPNDIQFTDSSSLGLYLIRILATEQLDGEIEVDNKKGTIFTITFNPYPK